MSVAGYRLTTMTTAQHATGTFSMDSWDETSHDEHGASKLTRVLVGKTFAGDLVGTSAAELITVVTEAGPAAYVGVERFDGTLHGRQGGFVLQHSAGARAGTPWLRWEVVETTGTGALAGITGEGQIIVGEDGGHSYVLDYELPGS